MLWLTVIILAYFLFSIVSLGDKYLLIGPPNPKTYSFYVGVLGGLAIILIPFVGFYIPSIYEIVLSLLAGAIYLLAIFSIYQGLENFEASRIIPAIGGLVPIFTFLFVYAFSGGKEMLGPKEILAFILLVLGSVLVTYSPFKKIAFKSLKISAVAALFLSLTFVLSKYVYLALPFWTGFIWIRIGVLISALLLLFIKEVRQEVFTKRSSFNRKTGVIFLLNQLVGGGAFILQNWAIALAPLVFLSIINALQGVQYIFLFIFTLFFLKTLGEETSKRIIMQKIFAIILILFGLIIIAL